MPTNFKKWRDTLTPEDVIRMCNNESYCGKICPAVRYCDLHPLHQTNCKEIFTQWGNKEAE